MGKVYGVAVIGAGGVFRQHGPAWMQLGKRAKMVGLADVDAARLERSSHGNFIPVLAEDYRDLLRRDDVDVVDICTPPKLHEQMILDALQAGKHVVCEKPLAPDLATADRIVDAARQSDRKLTTVFQMRTTPEIRRVLSLRDRGELGALCFGHFLRYGKLPAGSAGWWGRWDTAGGGALMTQFIHEIDLMRHIFGAPVQVVARIDTLRHEIESEDTATVRVRFESGAVATGVCSVTGHQWLERYDIVGDAASAHLPWSLQGEGGFALVRTQRQLDREIPLGSRGKKPGLVGKVVRKASGGRLMKPKSAPPRHTAYMAAFLDALDAGSEVPVPPEDSRATLELCMAMYTSALEGRPVDLPLERSCSVYEGISTETYDGRKKRMAARAG